MTRLQKSTAITSNQLNRGIVMAAVAMISDYFFLDIKYHSEFTGKQRDLLQGIAERCEKLTNVNKARIKQHALNQRVVTGEPVDLDEEAEHLPTFVDHFANGMRAVLKMNPAIRDRFFSAWINLGNQDFSQAQVETLAEGMGLVCNLVLDKNVPLETIPVLEKRLTGLINKTYKQQPAHS